jgi:hypothetical protein
MFFGLEYEKNGEWRFKKGYGHVTVFKCIKELRKST